MNVTPIIFQDAMVRALLKGRKTQTRRVVKPQLEWLDKKPFFGAWGYRRGKQYLHVGGDYHPDGWERIKAGCPYGKPGDLLWVREAWHSPKKCLAGYDGMNGPDCGWRRDRNLVIYREGAWYQEGRFVANHPKGDPERWIPSIHMPRWASRLTLRLTDVRVERVQAISEEDAKAEGAPLAHFGEAFEVPDIFSGWGWFPDRAHHYGFQGLWDSINGPRGFGWDANPWVWVLEFDVIPKNVDAVFQDDPETAMEGR
ncbi:MAG: hypothetical protein ACLFRB_06650 [Thiohalorhabdus sp.]|uniref:hypothetical protein n=1 Tax=Thiohalorhabdus sp. TaxID=3094134 RepID=UPI0039813B70